MPLALRIIAIAISLSMFIVTVELIRREQLKERYSLLWLATAVSMFILSFWTGFLDAIALIIGIIIPANALFFIGTIFLMCIIFYITIVVSELSKQNERLAQEITLLKKRTEELEKRSNSPGRCGPVPATGETHPKHGSVPTAGSRKEKVEFI